MKLDFLVCAEFCTHPSALKVNLYFINVHKSFMYFCYQLTTADQLEEVSVHALIVSFFKFSVFVVWRDEKLHHSFIDSLKSLFLNVTSIASHKPWLATFPKHLIKIATCCKLFLGSPFFPLILRI